MPQSKKKRWLTIVWLFGGAVWATGSRLRCRRGRLSRRCCLYLTEVKTVRCEVLCEIMRWKSRWSVEVWCRFSFLRGQPPSLVADDVSRSEVDEDVNSS
ncbi:hypothetical protein CONLIGDRAFT_274490 [Coniochaeta ligniaria NRRL 30616]|uniref:Uncharacterized protein n=1 Tax=Coniochaeta ligniaria NRRL 30616 TaxID=1408157 RepID=A0A1J7IYK5_9PEZI|nr:hypothetical protein CONLIGDRAFT_274490 [Coniochaeta ligniaria NRRL 30616]